MFFENFIFKNMIKDIMIKILILKYKNLKIIVNILRIVLRVVKMF